MLEIFVDSNYWLVKMSQKKVNYLRSIGKSDLENVSCQMSSETESPSTGSILFGYGPDFASDFHWCVALEHGY